jgi:regulator of protease activity HflC (stomatin/prohibitin superfamily)
MDMKNIKSTVLIAIGVVVVILLLVGSSATITLKPGERGVVFRKFTTGLDKENVKTEGFHIIAPWNRMIVYDVREQQVEESLDVLDKNGLSVSVDVTMRFNPFPNEIGTLHERFGKDYIRKLVIPEMRSSVRQVMGRYTAEGIYSTMRQEVETAIITETRETLRTDKNNIEMSALLIRSIKLPTKIKEAIEFKLEEEQKALAYEYRLDREQSEAERKRIGAEGEARANKIINNSLTPELLRMRGIEATVELSKSANSKVVVIGSGDSGLPLILGNN